MTEQYQVPEYAGYQPVAAAPLAKKRKHVFRWFFIIVQVIFLIWVITGIASGHGHATDCGTLDQQTCDSASHAGTAIGVGLLIFFWIMIDIALGVGRVCVLLARRPRH